MITIPPASPPPPSAVIVACRGESRVISGNQGLTHLVQCTKMGDMTQSGAVTARQAAGILGVSRWTVVRKIKAGDLIAEKLGDNTSAWLLNRADVERLAQRQAAS